jgi:poly-D-alanine transfer protein DltD
MSEDAIRITELESKLRFKDFNEKLNSMKNLSPAIRDLALPILELAHQSDVKKTRFSFNEEGKVKKVTASELVDNILKSIPSIIDFNEFEKKGRNRSITTENNSNFSEESQDLHNRITNYVQEQKSKGIEISYQFAASQIVGENQ